MLLAGGGLSIWLYIDIDSFTSFVGFHDDAGPIIVAIGLLIIAAGGALLSFDPNNPLSNPKNYTAFLFSVILIITTFVFLMEILASPNPLTDWTTLLSEAQSGILWKWFLVVGYVVPIIVIIGGLFYVMNIITGNRADAGFFT